MIRKLVFRFFKILVLYFLTAILIAPEWPSFNDELYQINSIVGLNKFDFLLWELNAIAIKGEAILDNSHTYLDQQTRKRIVLDYLKLVQEIKQLEGQIEIAFSDPNINEPESTTNKLQRVLEGKRVFLSKIQPTAEAILQDQVADIVVDDGFDILGQAWPPVMMHMTPLPSILIISPRDRIDRIYGIPLVNGLPIPTRESFESAVYEQLDLSALVVPIGGLGIYPSMVTETSNINRLAEVIAHEWAHHWLGPYPISLYYGLDPQVRTMNETVASIVGTEVGALMIERYYPEYIPSPAPKIEIPVPSTDPPPFIFQAEMAETRRQVDLLLADGNIDEAEVYMEVRRQFFVENGYLIRKLNQAYFAFYGAYADEVGATGSDPIGPMLLELRSKSSSLNEFLRVVAPISSFEELETLLAEVKQAR